MSTTNISDVYIIGGGPVGLILAVNLAQSGFKVIALEANADFFTALCAIGDIPPVSPEFANANILDATKKASKSHDEWIPFRRSTAHEIVDATPPVPRRPGPRIFPQSKLTSITLDPRDRLPSPVLESHEDHIGRGPRERASLAEPRDQRQGAGELGVGRAVKVRERGGTKDGRDGGAWMNQMESHGEREATETCDNRRACSSTNTCSEGPNPRGFRSSLV